MIAALLGSGPVPVDPAARIDRLEALERLKSAACAAQARITSAVVDAGEPSRSVGAQVGLARREPAPGPAADRTGGGAGRRPPAHAGGVGAR